MLFLVLYSSISNKWMFLWWILNEWSPCNKSLKEEILSLQTILSAFSSGIQVAFLHIWNILKMAKGKTFPVLVPHYSKPGANFVIEH